MASNWSNIDWSSLDRLRNAFLEGSAGETDYWKSESDLESYNQTYAKRIGWKWDYVLRELQQRKWEPPAGETLDWGCGTGIAHRAFFKAFPPQHGELLSLWDRSPKAMSYAANAARELLPELALNLEPAVSPTTLLISHVLTELNETDLASLVDRVRGAECVVWVEPGTYEASRRLIALREELRNVFCPVAPCLHARPCGLLTDENQPHWCHHFADPPSSVFTDPNWSRFSRLTGIDLRSLPLSYLVLDRRPTAMLSHETVRMIGRPRVYKAHALLLGCSPDGVCECRLSKRNLPEIFKRAKKDQLTSLQEWTLEGTEIAGLKECLPE